MALILSGTDGLSDVDGSAATPAIRGTDTNTGIFFPAADTIAFSEGGVESMRLDSSGNVGIGINTNRNSNKLDVFGNIAFGANASYYGQIGYNAGVGSLDLTSSDGGFRFIRQSGSVTSMTLDSSGNLGLGVTPSAWQAGSGIQFQDGVSFTRYGYTRNAYFDGTNYRYISNAVASWYLQAAGAHSWWNAPSGTAGNAITFTQAMTLDASGLLMVGATSNDGRRLTITGNTNDLSGIGITYVGVAASSIAVNSSGAMTFNLNNSDGKTERMRIDSSGNVGIGTSNPEYTLDVRRPNSSVRVGHNSNGFGVGLSWDNASGLAQVWSLGGYALVLGTNATERMRIDSSGNLLVGTTSGAGKVRIVGVSSNYSLFISGYGNSIGYGIGLQPATTNADPLVFFNSSGTLVGNISTSSSNTTYTTTSDYRLKENIAPMTGALAKVALLKPCTYTWKVDGSDGQGFIAHELQEVVPDAVKGEKDAVSEDGSIKPQGIDTSFLVATLTAAIQEQQALINDLTTRLTALENK